MNTQTIPAQREIPVMWERQYVFQTGDPVAPLAYVEAPTIEQARARMSEDLRPYAGGRCVGYYTAAGRFVRLGKG